MQHVAEEFILLGWEKAEVTVGDPFQLHRLAETLNLCLTLSCLDFSP